MLQAVAQRFNAVTRAGDLLARLGGDEFALIAHGVASPMEAREIANRFVATLTYPIDVGEQPHYVGVSVGIAFYPQHGGTPGDVLHSADVAMYLAKQHGYSNVRLFGEGPGRLTA